MTRGPVRSALPGTALALVGLGGWLLAAPQPAALDPVGLVLLTMAVAIADLLPIQLPHGRSVATSMALLAAGALLGVPAPLLAVVAMFGWVVARFAGVDEARPGGPLLRAAVALGLGGVVQLTATLPTWPDPPGAGPQIHVVAVATVAVLLVLVWPGVEALQAPGARSAWRRWRDELDTSLTARIAIASTGVLGAIVSPALGPWAWPSLLVPLLAARLGLNRFTGITVAYDQTIRAMSRLPEKLGAVDEDHSVRVAELAVAEADRLHLDLGLRVDLERAAHLHELGHISLYPEEMRSRAEMAVAGARVISSAGGLDRVAAIVAAHGDPKLAAGAPDDVARAARILTDCCRVAREEAEQAT